MENKYLLEIGYKIILKYAELNSKGFIQRDVKPENIMITNDFQIKIIDLGAV